MTRRRIDDLADERSHASLLVLVHVDRALVHEHDVLPEQMGIRNEVRNRVRYARASGDLVSSAVEGEGERVLGPVVEQQQVGIVVESGYLQIVVVGVLQSGRLAHGRRELPVQDLEVVGRDVVHEEEGVVEGELVLPKRIGQSVLFGDPA